MDDFTLTASDRCDKANCGARAYWRFVHRETLSELLFCGHHGSKVHAVVNHDSYVVFDERAQLDVKLDASA